jgi:hypothetical protein
VLATIDPFDNLVRGDVYPWPPPELVQKLYASERWRGKTEEDDSAARRCLGHYSDLQSLNSEDALTWSFFGPLIYGGPEWRSHFATSLFKQLGFPLPTTVSIWLWRRIPHPEKCTSNGGPEIDFGIQSEDVMVLGEAKWNSAIATRQGVSRNRSQQDLRQAHCTGFGLKAAPAIRNWVLLGVGRGSDVLKCTATSPNLTVANRSWNQIAAMMPDDLRQQLQQYLAWKTQHSSKHTGRSRHSRSSTQFTGLS